MVISRSVVSPPAYKCPSSINLCFNSNPKEQRSPIECD